MENENTEPIIIFVDAINQVIFAFPFQELFVFNPVGVNLRFIYALKSLNSGNSYVACLYRVWTKISREILEN